MRPATLLRGVNVSKKSLVGMGCSSVGFEIPSGVAAPEGMDGPAPGALLASRMISAWFVPSLTDWVVAVLVSILVELGIPGATLQSETLARGEGAVASLEPVRPLFRPLALLSSPTSAAPSARFAAAFTGVRCGDMGDLSSTFIESEAAAAGVPGEVLVVTTISVELFCSPACPMGTSSAFLLEEPLLLALCPTELALIAFTLALLAR
ncbi:hypothetical protein DFP72DRAFT_871460 [Ephemerocybe angulata]|uniref:Uncharacterized protein n=1 Tax=Ephemerocybe angulata TaxID=980116 RepID=A0A8H6MFM5_9AGAR|nr:hypothetical protein DFP72DRAFT_871460 [Tulosesus angulatus]